MKNHIKNYIKIMGLAAVPFGTAQAEGYEIKVTQRYTCDPDDLKSEKDGAMHFKISMSRDGEEPRVAEIVWPNDKEYLNPIFEPNGFVRIYAEELLREEDVLDKTWDETSPENVCANIAEWMHYYNGNFKGKEDKPRFEQMFGGILNENTFFKFYDKEIGRKRRGLKILEEFNREEMDFVKSVMKDLGRFLRSRTDSSEGCSCVMYAVRWKDTTFEGVQCWLMRDLYSHISPSRYLFAFSFAGLPHEDFYISSDIPTTCFDWVRFNSHCYNSNVILSKSRRATFFKYFVARGDELDMADVYGDEPRAKFFIKRKCLLDEIELSGESTVCGGCHYFVQTDPFGEKITDIWEKGKRLNIDDIKDRKFKDPKEIVKFLEKKFGKK